MEIVRECPMCGETHYIGRISFEKWDKWARGELIQDAFPDLDAFEREFIKTGYCPECQAMLFGLEYKRNRIK